MADDDGKTDAPAPLTLEAVQQMINGALTAQKKAHKAELDGLRADFAKAKEPPPPPPEDEEKKTAIQVARDLKARLDAAEKREQAKDAKLRKQHEEKSFADAWAAKGLDPKHARAQLALLREDGKVKVSDDERVYVGDDPLEAHIEAFAKEHGDSYRPAKPASGEGKGAAAAAAPMKNGKADLSATDIVAAVFGGMPIKQQ